MLDKVKRFSLFDWLLVLCAAFLLCGAALQLFFPGFLHKVIRDYPPHHYAEITVALDPRFEWLRQQIGAGDALMDSLEGRPFAQVLETRTGEGPFAGRTLVRLKVLVAQGDSGPTVFSRYKIRRGERFFFECPAYVFESLIVGWKGV